MSKRKRKPIGQGRAAVESVASRQARLAKASDASGGSKRQTSRAVTGRKFGRSKKNKTPERLVPWHEAVSLPSLAFAVALLAAVILYAFWPTFQWLESQWRNEPDYSHGYLVMPLAVALLWMRADTFPGFRNRLSYAGIWLLLVGVGMRIVGRIGYMDFMDGWAILPLVAGATWLMCGWPATRWAMPAILFLIMLVPLPYRAESVLSWNLQGIATTISTAMLRLVGLPAIPEGHTIWVGDNQLMIEQACSGLRIFVGMITLAFFWAATVRRGWLDRFVIIAMAIPLALLVNATRITVTGILYQWFSTAQSRSIIHDWSGYLMIPVAAGLLWLVKNYWESLYRPVQVFVPGERLRPKSA